VSSDEAYRKIGRYFTLLKECKAPIDVRINGSRAVAYPHHRPAMTFGVHILLTMADG